VKTPPRHAHYTLLGVAALLLGACDDETDTSGRSVNVTGVKVDPAVFLGGLECAEGRARSYKAELVNVEGEAVTAVSDAVGCARPVVFSSVIPGLRYGARISIFREVAGFEGEPAWTTECGLDGEGAALAENFEQVTVRGCSLIEVGPSVPQLVVDLGGSFGGLGCLEDGGRIAGLRVEPEAPSTLESVELTCASPKHVFTDGLALGEEHFFAITATDAEGTVAWGARCGAVVGASTTFASCSVLSEKATVVLPIADLVSEAGLVCGAPSTGSTTAARITVSGAVEVPQKIVPCDAAATVVGPAGSYSATVRLLEGTEVVTKFECDGELGPGEVAALACVAAD
jgi:hypothetical protein